MFPMMSLLRTLAGLCDVKHITEFGVRSGRSSIAFLMGLLDSQHFGHCHEQGHAIQQMSESFELVSYDIRHPQDGGVCAEIARLGGGKAAFIEGNTRKLERISTTDLVFIDALKVYPHVMHELELASMAGAKRVLLHDTEAFRYDSECVFYPTEDCSRKISCDGENPEDLRRGLADAIRDFLDSPVGSGWTEIKRMQIGWGLTILGRT